MVDRRGAGGVKGTRIFKSLLVVVVVLFSSCAHRRSSQRLPGYRVGGPTSYVSVRSVNAARKSELGIGVTDVRTGRLIRRIRSVPWDGMTVHGMAVDGRGRVWVTLSSGPTYRDNSLGGNPQPGSCRAEVLILDPHGGPSQVVLKGTRDQLVRDAAPSPDGSHLAYLTGGCTSYFNQSIRVDDLQTGKHVTIGAGLAPCHGVGAPRWTADGHDLAFVYGPSDPKQVTTGQVRPGCAEPLPSGLVVVSAERTQPGFEGSTTGAPDKECELVAVTPDATGFAAVESCSGPPYLTGPVNLLRFDPMLRQVGTTPLGRCANGSEITTDRTGTHLLVRSHQYCSPPGTTEPMTDLFTAAAASGPVTKRSSTSGGTNSPSNVAW